MSTRCKAAAEFCSNLARNRDFASYAATLFAPVDARRGLIALAAFNVEVSQVRDHVSQPLPGEIRLQWWRDVLTGEGGDERGGEGNPVAAELLCAVERHDLSTEALTLLVDAHVFDVYDDAMPDIAALEAHCRDTAVALYKLRARILGTSASDAERAADHAGIAEGLTHLMLALPRHAARRQMFLPRDLLEVHGVAPEEIFARKITPGLKDALAHLRREAKRQRDAALASLPDIPPPARTAFLPLALVDDQLNRLETSEPFDPPVMSRLRTLWVMWRAARKN